jgi:alanine dehydrogenase
VEVTDTGIGISSTEQQRIFERFYRTPEAQKMATFGLGLGLALTRHLVTAIANEHYIAQLAKMSDVMIGALSPKLKLIKPLVSEQVVQSMKPGSVIIDVSIDQGACFGTSRHTTHTNPIYVKHGVTHYCVPNIPSAVAKTATYALTNTLLPFLLKLNAHQTIPEILWNSHSLRKGAYIYKGYVTRKILAELTDLPFREIDMLLATA